MRPIGPNKIVLLVPSSHMSQGITGAGDRLFLYAPPRWIDAGYVELAGDNSGTCSDNPKERKDEHLDPCWKMTGTLNPVPASGKEFYDIRVTRSGTVEDKPAKNATLVFDGKTYVEKTP